MSRNDLQRLTTLFHHRWALPVLAELHRLSGAKFITLVNRLGISRDSLTTTLKSQIDAGWVVRNPGYGHPMRPEYVLTRAGAQLGPWCDRAMKVIAALRLEDVTLRKWSLPVALAMRRGCHRFSELRAFWPRLTARALAMTLKELQSAGLVVREVTNGYPPQTQYRLTTTGLRVSRAMEGIV